ncbi:DUF2750 domain-containing protein [Shewanella decolorationis]|nr:DUF2750 domain-containing protein [Shewanella decolorationis]
MSMMSQVAAFCREVYKTKLLWTIEFEDGSLLQWFEEDGSQVLPFWSSESRVTKVIELLKDFDSGVPTSIEFDEFEAEWVLDLVASNIRIGPNWTGENLSGTTFEANEMIRRIYRQGKQTSKNT